MLFIAITSCEKEKTVSESELPSAIKSYLVTHFADCGVSKVVREKKKKKISHDINLSCGVNIEFNDQDQVIDIDGTSQLPNSVIPAPILAYTSLNYPNSVIIGWELEGSNQHIELNTATELVFDSSGNFLYSIQN